MSDTQTVDLAAWLTQIWDEEEEAMKRVGERIWFVCDDGHFEEPNRDDDPWDGTGEYVRWDDGEYRLPNHHNTWLEAFNPASMLARIAADRKILELHSAEPHPLLTRSRVEPYPSEHLLPVCGECSGVDDPYVDQVAYPCTTLRLLASPYADRPGFQEEWKC